MQVDDQADLDDVANVIAREESRAAYMDTEEGALGDYDQLLYYRVCVLWVCVCVMGVLGNFDQLLYFRVCVLGVCWVCVGCVVLYA